MLNLLSIVCVAEKNIRSETGTDSAAQDLEKAVEMEIDSVETAHEKRSESNIVEGHAFGNAGVESTVNKPARKRITPISVDKS